MVASQSYLDNAAALLAKAQAAQIPQPDQNGEFATPLDGALWMALTYGIPQTPLVGPNWDSNKYPEDVRGKRPFLPDWVNTASTDPVQIRSWAAQYVGCNFGSVNNGRTVAFEVDSTDVRERFQAAYPGKDFTAGLVIISRQGGHRYYLNNGLVQNVGQTSDFSVRAFGEQCVSPGSIHAKTGKQYRVHKAESLAAPSAEEIAFWNSERVENKTPTSAQNSMEPIPSGQRNSTITSILGKARQENALEYDALLALARQHNQRCSPPLPESELETMAHSIARYPVKEAGKVLIGGVEVGTAPISTPIPADIEPVEIVSMPYPKFPLWVFGGIPAYDRWVKPYCKANTRYPEYMMMPLLVLILNYLSTKDVRIEFKDFTKTIYLLMVGKKGRVIKSSSAQDAMELCQKVGILASNPNVLKNAEGRTIVFTVGSTEGLGKEMNRLNCKNACLFYDEFSLLVAKMGIENSSMADHLSICYESGKFENGTQVRKNAFSFYKDYCVSLIACTTEKRYPRLASKLFSLVDGMDTRFFVLYQPEVLRDVEPQVGMPIPEDVVAETKAAIDKALEQKLYRIEDQEPLRPISKLGNRTEIRAEKWALAFAILLGRTSVDEDCVERGIALSKYEDAVKKYTAIGEAMNRESGLQREIRQHIERAGGSMKLRDLQRKVSYDNYSTDLWYRVYGGLVRSKLIAESGKGIPGDPFMVRVLVPLIREDEEGDE
jgi:Bifunctional DNA primase/polymerase, N-terminal/Primase C terminal 1 (PriCT-1)